MHPSQTADQYLTKAEREELLYEFGEPQHGPNRKRVTRPQLNVNITEDSFGESSAKVP
eukprot:SAG11_NODE_37630_length_256_cov_0.636943_1_plen_57_part_01